MQDHNYDLNLNRDAIHANFSDSEKISATLMQEKRVKCNCSPAIHCAGIACLNLGFSATPKARHAYRPRALIVNADHASRHA